jgi:hypothetical protein
VREKRISRSDASILGYLGQVMISNLKNLPPVEDANAPSKSLTDHYVKNYMEAILDKVNEEIARWIPDSSPIAVAQAEHDVVKIAADASAKEAARAAESQASAAPKPAPLSPAPPDKPQAPWAGFDGSSLRADAHAAKRRYAP